MNNKQKDFCQTWNLTENQFFGKEKIDGYLDLSSIKSIPKGFNPIVGGWLDLPSVKLIPEGFNPTVGGNLYLPSVKLIPEGFNPIVGGSLNLETVKFIPEGFNPTVGGNLFLHSVKSIPLGFNPIVGGSLYLESVKSIPVGFNPTVGGSLDLSSVTSIPEGFNPTVGGWLDLRSVMSIPAGFNPTVGGGLYLHSGSSNNKKPCPFMLSWQDGKYVKVDGIFTEVISKKKNVWKVKKPNQDKIFYLVTDGNGKYAHGDSIKDAKSSLIYKISDRDPSKYKHLTIESSLSTPEMIACYRTITGACEFGVKNFIQTSLNGKLKKKYKIKDIIKITENQYGNDSFKDFFIQNNP